MRPRGAYHTIIFAPDVYGDDGPQVVMPDRGVPGIGAQSTLPVAEPEPVLYDHRDEAIYFANPYPQKRPIGFQRR